LPKITFVPEKLSVEVEANTKILAAAIRAKSNIRYGCGSLKCGTCAVRIAEGAQSLSELKNDEVEMLKRLKLSTDGSVRMSCRSRVNTSEIVVDLDFQTTYSP
jgi:ferredoxin